jgi:hypothetical protein
MLYFYVFNEKKRDCNFKKIFIDFLENYLGLFSVDKICQQNQQFYQKVAHHFLTAKVVTLNAAKKETGTDIY